MGLPRCISFLPPPSLLTLLRLLFLVMNRERLSWALLFHGCLVLVHPSPQIVLFLSLRGLIVTFHTLFCGLWLWVEVFTRWVSCWTRPIASLLLLHLGSGWVLLEKISHSQHSQTWAMQLCCCQQTQPPAGAFMTISPQLLPLLQPRGAVSGTDLIVSWFWAQNLGHGAQTCTALTAVKPC